MKLILETIAAIVLLFAFMYLWGRWAPEEAALPEPVDVSEEVGVARGSDQDQGQALEDPLSRR